ncbi:hypothetical protein BH09VER1_BH09VER1_24170 [soil metagenome]
MKSLPWTISSFILLLALAACQDSSPAHQRHPASGPAVLTDETTPAPDATATPPQETAIEETTNPAPMPPPPTQASAPTNIPYGTPVPGKPGYVVSPFNQTGYVDVRGFPPGTEVKCPYTSKVFLVP